MFRPIALACLATVCAAGTAPAQTVLPPDPKPTCVVTPAQLATWFASGTVTPGGFVDPADSVGFSPSNDCDFYKWSSQMFLWLTSPSTASPYGGGSSMFDSPVFYDVSPQNAQHQRTLIPNTPGIPNPILPIRVNKPEEIGEVGQAGGSGVLISQAGSLVYYGIHVNDVYAQFLTGQKAGAIPATDFPTTQADLNAIQAYAGTTFADGIALTLELKTSWVDAATVDAGRHVTLESQVPLYARTSDTQWTLAGSETRTLALVGMHVVGSAQGHPELIWATFEHVDNTPDNTYYYTRVDGTTTAVPFSSAGNWLFMASGGTTAGANVERASVDSSGNIVAKSGQTIGPGNTYRINPWGDAGNAQGSAANNTEIVALNAAILPLLAGDVRQNYVLTGALWTQNGQVPPTGSPPPPQAGSLLLANSTMETYHQDINCFACHNGTSFNGLSHIYNSILPLPGK